MTAAKASLGFKPPLAETLRGALGLAAASVFAATFFAATFLAGTFFTATFLAAGVLATTVLPNGVFVALAGAFPPAAVLRGGNLEGAN